MQVTCAKCRSRSSIPDALIPIGRSFMLCPECGSRINIFKSLPVGAVVQNLTGLRFLRDEGEFCEQHCEPGELWRVVDVFSPCPDRGKGRDCERENRGRCPNQRLMLRLRKDRVLYKTCLYRKGRRVFDIAQRTAVGQTPPSSEVYPEDETHRVK